MLYCHLLPLKPPKSKEQRTFYLYTPFGFQTKMTEAKNRQQSGGYTFLQIHGDTQTHSPCPGWHWSPQLVGVHKAAPAVRWCSSVAAWGRRRARCTWQTWWSSWWKPAPSRSAGLRRLFNSDERERQRIIGQAKKINTPPPPPPEVSGSTPVQAVHKIQLITVKVDWLYLLIESHHVFEQVYCSKYWENGCWGLDYTAG